MDILFLLIPMSVLLVFAIIGLFAWSLQAGQFEDLDREGERILQQESPSTIFPPAHESQGTKR